MSTPEHTTPQYERSRLAHVIAEIVSGVVEATPERDDYELADKVQSFIEVELEDI